MRGKFLLLIAISLGLTSAFLVHQYLSSLAPMNHQEMADVVVASRTIRPNATIARDMLQMRQVPAETVHPDALRTFQEAQGRIVSQEIIGGETVLERRLLPPGRVPSMSFVIPSDQRAVTIAVNEVKGVAGFVKPGDKVDILATFDTERPTTITVLENVMVLAISQNMEADTNPQGRLSTSVTLALNPQQVERLTLAEEQGSLRLALRPPEASNLASRQGTDVDSLHPLAFARSRQSASAAQETPVQPTEDERRPAPTEEPPSAPAVEPDDRWVVEVIRGSHMEVSRVNEDSER